MKTISMMKNKGVDESFIICPEKLMINSFQRMPLKIMNLKRVALQKAKRADGDESLDTFQERYLLSFFSFYTSHDKNVC